MKKHEKILVTETRLLTQDIKVPVLRGARDILYKQWESKSTGSSSIEFACPTPFEGAEIDRSINLVVPVRLTFTKADMPSGGYIFNPNLCNLRSYPIQKALKTIKMTLNNNALSVNLSNILSALEHYNTSAKLKYLEYSKCPTYGTCQSQSFSDIPQGSRSGLAIYADSISGIAPQNYPFTVVSQTNSASEGGEGLATSVVDFVSIETLMLSPLYWGDSESNFQSLRGITTMDFSFEFVNNSGFRMMAIDNNGDGSVFGAGATTVSSQFSFDSSDNFSYDDLKPKLLINYLKPQEPFPKDAVHELNYYHIQERSSLHSSSMAANETAVLSSPQILLQQLPSKIWVFARKSMTSTFLVDPYTPDSFMALKALRILWNDRIVFSGAHPAQIYDISVGNGLQLEYSSWSGNKFNVSAQATPGSTGFGTASQQYAGTGSIACFDVLDLGITSEMERHPNGTYALQIDATMKNVSADTFTPELFIVTLTDGLLTVQDGLVTTRMGIEDYSFDELKEGEASRLKRKNYANVSVPLLFKK